jgi:hypothetical protein
MRVLDSGMNEFCQSSASQSDRSVSVNQLIVVRKAQAV